MNTWVVEDFWWSKKSWFIWQKSKLDSNVNRIKKTLPQILRPIIHYRFHLECKVNFFAFWSLDISSKLFSYTNKVPFLFEFPLVALVRYSSNTLYCVLPPSLVITAIFSIELFCALMKTTSLGNFSTQLLMENSRGWFFRPLCTRTTKKFLLVFMVCWPFFSGKETCEKKLEFFVQVLRHFIRLNKKGFSLKTTLVISDWPIFRCITNCRVRLDIFPIMES